MERIGVILTYVRATKNKYLFKEDGDTDAVQSLYINKKFFDEQDPAGMKLRLVVEEVED